MPRFLRRLPKPEQGRQPGPVVRGGFPSSCESLSAWLAALNLSKHLDALKEQESMTHLTLFISQTITKAALSSPQATDGGY